MRRHRFRRRAAFRGVDCRHVGARLHAYLDGELDHAHQATVSGHLRDCRRCGMEASTYRALKASLRRNTRTPYDAASLHRLREFAERLAAGDVDAGHQSDDTP